VYTFLMTKQEAISLLDNVCNVFRGTRQDHMKLMEAINLFKTLEEPQKKNGIPDPKSL